ncbi:hypothetical protein TWF281_003825 [Arthrobotrys megalospora]
MAARTTSSPTPTTSYPLTTQFIPPTSCFSKYWFPTVSPGFTASAVFVNGPPILVQTAATECWPQDFISVGPAVRGKQTFYSPGICPSGYNTASQMYVSRTMYAYCCMTGYELLDQQGPQNLIRTTIFRSDFIDDDNTSAVCFQSLPTAIALEYESANGEIHTTDLRRGHSVIQFPIRVKYQASDFSRFPIDAQPTDLPEELQGDLEPYIRSGLVTIGTQTGPGPTSSVTGTGVKTETGTDSVPSKTGGAGDTPDEGRTGTIAIAVGVTVSVVIVLAVAGYFLFAWRRKRSRQQNGVFEKPMGPYTQHQNNDSHIGGIQDLPDNTGGIALAEAGAGGWSKRN